MARPDRDPNYQAFLGMTPQMRKRFRGAYFAFAGGKIVGSGNSGIALAKRIARKFPMTAILIMPRAGHVTVRFPPRPRRVRSAR